MRFTEKITSIFKLSKVKEVKGAKVWIVSWNARYDVYSRDYNRVAKAFLSKQDAELFVDSLREAKELLQYSECINISIDEQK